jgi:GAF domain-containing protein
LSSPGHTPEEAEILRLIAAQVAPALEAGILRGHAEQQVNRLAATLEHLPVGVVVLDAVGLVITLNAEGRRLSGAGS